MTERDPSPSEILADMLFEAPDDAVGEWRVKIPTRSPLVRNPPSFAVSVEIARQALRSADEAGGGSREAVALSGLLTAALVRHELGRCDCGAWAAPIDSICGHARDLATAIAGF